MLHRAIVGSLERFIGILIEQHAGAMPTWLAPVQAAVLNITDAQADYVREVAQKLQKAFPNQGDRKSTRLNSSHQIISYAVFCLKKKKKQTENYVKHANRRDTLCN